MDLTWSLDYCLACDRQVTSGGAYCSQSCRLADLESSSHWSSPTSPSTSATTASWASSGAHQGSGFYLAPAINFAAYSLTNTSSSLTTSNANSKDQSSSIKARPIRTLSPSSSRSSLSSTGSESAQIGPFSEQVYNELRAYANSFDTTRNWRRRRATWS